GPPPPRSVPAASRRPSEELEERNSPTGGFGRRPRSRPAGGGAAPPDRGGRRNLSSPEHRSGLVSGRMRARTHRSPAPPRLGGLRSKLKEEESAGGGFRGTFAEKARRPRRGPSGRRASREPSTGKPRRDGQFRRDPSGWPEAACVDAKNGWRRGGGSAGGVAANVPRQWPGATASSLISRQHPPHSRYEGCW